MRVPFSEEKTSRPLSVMTPREPMTRGGSSKWRVTYGRCSSLESLIMRVGMFAISRPYHRLFGLAEESGIVCGQLTPLLKQ
jgi:hypothetical protein